MLQDLMVFVVVHPGGSAAIAFSKRRFCNSRIGMSCPRSCVLQQCSVAVANRTMVLYIKKYVALNDCFGNGFLVEHDMCMRVCEKHSERQLLCSMLHESLPRTNICSVIDKSHCCSSKPFGKRCQLPSFHVARRLACAVFPNFAAALSTFLWR